MPAMQTTAVMPDGGWGQKWLPVIQAVVKIKSVIPPEGSVTVGPITPVWDMHARANWGSEMSPLNISMPGPQVAAAKAYAAKVEALQDDITKIREERGADDPEYLEAQRLFNIAFR